MSRSGESHSAANARAGTSAVRTEQIGSRVHSAHTQPDANLAKCEPARTEPMSPEQPPLAVDGVARIFTAHLFDKALERRWENEEEWASNRCIAERFCKNSESVVRRWRSGEKTIPLAVLRILPAPFGWELARGLLDGRGGVQRPVMALNETIDRLDSPVPPDDRNEVLRALTSAHRKLGARIERLVLEGR